MILKKKKKKNPTSNLKINFDGAVFEMKTWQVSVWLLEMIEE